ncbi:MAG: TrkA family potassium uptake protein, partial [Flavobacteriaceae bacterium]
MLRLFKSKIYLAVGLMLSMLLIGVLGFHFLSGLSWLDALYMTIITVTTVGFTEVGPMPPHVKIFTVFLIIASVFVFAYAISVITEYIVGRNTLELLKRKKLKNQINHMEDHIILCGYGRNGTQAAERLKAYKRPFVVIEKDKDIIERHGDEVLFVEGDANED